MLFLVTFVLLIHLLLLTNTRFTLWPEMVVYPYLLNNGFSLYKDIINPYPPLMVGFLSIFSKISGYGPIPFQILTWLMILVTNLSIFFVTQKLFKNSSLALLSTLFFVILSVPFLINGLWFDLVQTPLIIFSFYFFYQYLSKKKSEQLFFSFFLLTIAFFIKQQTLWLIAFFIIVLIVKSGKKTKEIFIKNPFISLPFFFLIFLQIIIFWQKGLIWEYLYWVYYFPFFLASKMPGYVLFPTIRQLVTVSALFLLFTPIILKKNLKLIFPVVTGLVLVLFAYPRFDYFHLIPTLAILSLVVGQNLKAFSKSKLKAQTIFVLSLIFLSIFTIKYFKNNLTREVRFFEKDMYGQAAFLKKITVKDEPVYIQNGPDQLLPLAQRLPIKPWAIQFPWYLELEGIQDRILEGLKQEKPKFIIYKPYDSLLRYEIGGYRPQKIADFVEQNYQNLIKISDTLWLKVKQ